jgi:hypothetical protein
MRKTEDPHAKNAEGKEVKKGGKEANKKQTQSKANAKSQPGEKTDKQHSKDPKKTNHAETNGKSRSKAKETSAKDPPRRQEGDMVSTRTRSQSKK